MDKHHKQVMTTSDVAIKAGQTRVHVPARAMHPWLREVENIKCPNCDASYLVFAKFPQPALNDILTDHHTNKRDHPDVIPSTTFWHLEDCDVVAPRHPTAYGNRALSSQGRGTTCTSCLDRVWFDLVVICPMHRAGITNVPKVIGFFLFQYLFGTIIYKDLEHGFS